MENENNFNEINSNLNNNSNNSSNLNNINNNLNSNYSLKNQSNSRNNKGLIIVLILIILGLVGYIAYDKLNENSTNKCENQENNKQEENKKDNNKLNEDIDPAKIKDGEYLLEKNFSIKFNGRDLKVSHKLYYSDADFNFDFDVFINDKKITTDAVWVSASREDYQEIKKQFLEIKSTVKVFKNENKEYLYVSHYYTPDLKIFDADLNLLGSVKIAFAADFPPMSKSCKNYSRYNSNDGGFTTIVVLEDGFYYLTYEYKSTTFDEHKVTIKDNKLVDEIIDTCLSES